MAHLQSLQDKLGYHFINSNLLDEAFIAAGASVSRTDIEGPVQGNKRLALVGDAVLRLCVLDEWYPEGADTETGDNLVEDVGTNKRLKQIANEWKLADFLKENPCQQGGKTKTTLASAVEAVIGAVWYDSQKDIAAVQQLIKKLKN
ncbi:ribonuclease III [Corynespora cassiicola Philippines]|uniref:Ribonuclease III n=1 Tax=Corynespora cassiicola Philippines TaxID=1448308 RepID=A0A2T2N0H0_CORCC|nr:ribonuclease III [Corynespora cassiicola Philippines]